MVSMFQAFRGDLSKMPCGMGDEGKLRFRFIVSCSSPEYAKITRMMGLVFKDEWGEGKKELVHSVPVTGTRREPFTEEELDEMVDTYPWDEFDKVLRIQQRLDGDWKDLRYVTRETFR